MHVLFGQILLCCLLPNGLEGDEDSRAWSRGRVVPICSLANETPEAPPAAVPASPPTLSTGKRERTVGAEDRPGKRLRRGLTANRSLIAGGRAILFESHTPVPVPMTVQARGIRLQI